jgi:hypothetical protein
MRVEEGRAHRAALHRERETERQKAADHVTILTRNRMARREEFLNTSSDCSGFRAASRRESCL